MEGLNFIHFQSEIFLPHHQHRTIGMAGDVLDRTAQQQFFQTALAVRADDNQRHAQIIRGANDFFPGGANPQQPLHRYRGISQCFHLTLEMFQNPLFIFVFECRFN